MNFLKSSIFAITIGWCATASAGLINFDVNTPIGVPGQDDVPNRTVTTEDSGFTLKLVGNTSQNVLLDSVYNVSAGTILYFDYFSDNEGEIQGIGLDNNSSINGSTLFKLFGADGTSASTDFNNYSISDGWKQYMINVGSYFTGNFDRLVFLNDQDSGPYTANGSFRNVELCDGCQRTIANAIPEPSSWALLILGAFGLYLRKKSI